MDSMMRAMGFKRVVDYGVPIARWCDSLHGEIPADQRPCRGCIPVFAVIPEGERPQTTWGETGGDDAVCCESDDDVFVWYGMGYEHVLPNARLTAYLPKKKRWLADRGDDYEAIRHVAEE